MARAVLGAEAEWSLDAHLLAYIGDGIWAGVWQRGGKGKKPTPIPRPGDKPDDMTIGSVRTFAEIDEMRKSIRRG